MVERLAGLLSKLCACMHAVAPGAPRPPLRARPRPGREVPPKISHPKFDNANSYILIITIVWCGRLVGVADGSDVIHSQACTKSWRHAPQTRRTRLNTKRHHHTTKPINAINTYQSPLSFGEVVLVLLMMVQIRRGCDSLQARPQRLERMGQKRESRQAHPLRLERIQTDNEIMILMCCTML